jgi:uncharacterized protein (TIGR03503 family)
MKFRNAIPLQVVGTLLGMLLHVYAWGADEDTTATSSEPAPKSLIVPTAKASDVRVIVDISGSMRQNDPENLRVPAVNLIVELLPEGAKAGVWTFGQWVNMLVAPQEVNDVWRESAKQKAQSINSHGLRTNIGEAMEKATWKFQSDSQFEQHVILLTDGLVDIAKESDPNQAQKNEAERKRIINEVLAKYQELGVKVHTIALSDNADKVLLDKLSLDTGGMSEVVNSSEQLVKAFLKAFEKAAPQAAEQVPLAQDNTFEIDESIEEFTALIFRKKDTPPSQLVSPDGQVISQIKGAENARWFSESVYDLVTVKNPQGGTWKINAELDPDNRVTVVSDLKMEIINLPTTLFPGQQVDFEVYLHEEGKILTNADFLRLMSIEMKMTAESGRSGIKQISDPENIPGDGRYRESIKRLSKEGQYELQVTVDGKTFQRMRKAYIQVRQPIGFEIRKRLVNDQMAYAVRVIPQVPDVEVSKTRVIGKLKGPDQHSIIQAVPWIEEGVWETIIEQTKGPGVYEVALNVKGRFAEDQEFRIKPDGIKLTFPVPEDFSHEYFVKEELTPAQIAALEAPKTEEPVASEEAPVVPDLAKKMEEQAEPPAEEVSEETVPEETVAEDSDEMAEEVPMEDAPIPFWIYILIPVLTLGLGLGGFFIYRHLASKKSDKIDLPEDSGGAMEESAPAPSVSLNDGMDDEDFDDDFDLSDSDDEEDFEVKGNDLDDLDELDLSNDDEDDDESDALDDIDDVVDEDTESVTDEIPDFDENFDIDVDPDLDLGADLEPEEDDTSAAIDELDSVLDSLGDEEEEAIPQLEEEEPVEEPEEEPEVISDGEAAIDEALANLESELDDIDVDALTDDGEDKTE